MTNHWAKSISALTKVENRALVSHNISLFNAELFIVPCRGLHVILANLYELNRPKVRK